MQPTPTVASVRAVVAGLLFATGATALILQITWQRVIALHAGVDLESSATVVTAFLAGLGLGGLLGGRLADRVRPRGAFAVLAGVNAGVAATATVSIWLLYDVYQRFAADLDGLPARFAFNATIVLVPTILQGMTLPLVARAVTSDVDRAASQIGRFNAANTVGAASGAFVGGWVLLGRYGFDDVVHLVAVVHVFAAAIFAGLARPRARTPSRAAEAVGAVLALVLAAVAYRSIGRVVGGVQQFAGLWRPAGVAAGAVVSWAGFVAFVRPTWRSPSPVPLAAGYGDEIRPAREARSRSGEPPWLWFVAYALTGAVALGFEQVFFRLIDGVMRSNSYTFAHVLSLYLGLLGVGIALGAWVRPRVADDRRAFLWLQFSVGLTAVASLVIVAEVLPAVLEGRYGGWFNSDGFAGGFADTGRADQLLFGLGIPLLLMAPPVVLAGASFPFVQGLVTQDLETIGRRTGLLVCANLIGNVGGALLTSFVLIDRLGTAGTYRVLVLPLAVAGVVAAGLATSPLRRTAGRVAVVGAIGASALLVPSNQQLWATLHGTDEAAIVIAEDRSCASGLELYGDDRSQLTINGAGQNGYPFDDFHVLIGLLPALAHPDPDRTLAIGLGIGSTSWSLLASGRVGEVTSVELCGGNYDLVADRAEAGIDAFERLDGDPRHVKLVGDGRRHLLVAEESYDIIVPDTVRPNSAGSGNLYSREFQELVAERLAPGGIVAGWYPTFRSLNAVSVIQPYVVALSVPSYGDSPFYLASDRPISLDPTDLVERFDAIAHAFGEEQRGSLRSFLADLEVECVNDGRVAAVASPEHENRDLHPRDEYFIANGGIPEDQVARTCR